MPKSNDILISILTHPHLTVLPWMKECDNLMKEYYYGDKQGQPYPSWYEAFLLIQVMTDLATSAKAELGQ